MSSPLHEPSTVLPFISQPGSFALRTVAVSQILHASHIADIALRYNLLSTTTGPCRTNRRSVGAFQALPSQCPYPVSRRWSNAVFCAHIQLQRRLWWASEQLWGRDPESPVFAPLTDRSVRCSGCKVIWTGRLISHCPSERMQRGAEQRERKP